MAFQKVIQIFKIKEIRNKILYVFGILVVFRIAAAVPVPGVDSERLKSFFESSQFGQLFGLVNVFTGGAMENFSIVMLGLGPYITATIILQLFTMIFPKLKEMYHESGEQGRQKFNQFGRLLTVPLAALQAYGTIALFRSNGVIGDISVFTLTTSIIVISAGTVFLMWLGELISEKGIGNGVSLMIFAGIIAGIPTSVGQTLIKFERTEIFSMAAFAIVSILVVASVVVITEGQRNIPVSYAKRIRGNRVYGGVFTHLPMRVNQAGVIPIIFALSVMIFPGVVASFFSTSNIAWVAKSSTFIANMFQNNTFYAIIYFVLVVLFTYFYTAVTYDPKAISENLQKQGGFIPGIRPGRSTADFIYGVMNRITLVGALFLGVIAILPLIVQGITGVTTMTIGGTAVLIVVAVVLESMKQVESQLVMRDYEGF